jgi:hypothetical protein
MSEIAEVRKIFQDLIAPDVKSVSTDLAALKNSIDKQFGAAEALAQARFATTLAKLETMEAVQTARHEAIIKALDIDKRLERIEARQAATAAA